MNKPYNMYIDEDGIPNMEFINSLDSRNLLSVFFISDVGLDVNYGRKLISIITSIIKGELEYFNSSGNLFDLDIKKNIVIIENLYDDTRKIDLPTSEFLNILNDWIELIRGTVEH